MSCLLWIDDGDLTMYVDLRFQALWVAEKDIFLVMNTIQIVQYHHRPFSQQFDPWFDCKFMNNELDKLMYLKTSFDAKKGSFQISILSDVLIECFCPLPTSIWDKNTSLHERGQNMDWILSFVFLTSSCLLLCDQEQRTILFM